MNSLHPYRTNRPITAKGITLVEILVVITIIVVLAALSTVGIARARSTARGATCTSNLRQIGAAMISYATDNSGQLPPLEDRGGDGDALKGWWTVILADGGYLDRAPNKNGKLTCGAGVWACPDCTVERETHNGYGVAEGTVMKTKLGSAPTQRSLRLSEIPNPERTWLVGDAAKSKNAKDVKTGWYAVWANPTKWGNSNSPSPRHGGKVNVCMVDGHVESLTLKELEVPNRNYTMYK